MGSIAKVGTNLWIPVRRSAKGFLRNSLLQSRSRLTNQMDASLSQTICVPFPHEYFTKICLVKRFRNAKTVCTCLQKKSIAIPLDSTPGDVAVQSVCPLVYSIVFRTYVSA